MNSSASLEIIQGDSERLIIPIKDADSQDWIFNLKDFNLVYKVTENRGGGKEVINITDTDTEVTVEEAGQISVRDAETFDDSKLGKYNIPSDYDVFVITLSPSDTNSLTEYTYYHECQVTDTKGHKKTVFQGKVTITESST